MGKYGRIVEFRSRLFFLISKDRIIKKRHRNMVIQLLRERMMLLSTVLIFLINNMNITYKGTIVEESLGDNKTLGYDYLSSQQSILNEFT